MMSGVYLSIKGGGMQKIPVQKTEEELALLLEWKSIECRLTGLI